MSTPLTAPAHTSAGLDLAWAGLGEPGDWFDAATRFAIARETRAARACGLCARRTASLSPLAGTERHEPGAGLEPAALDATHRITSDPGRLSGLWYERALAEGLSPEEVVEITGVVGVVTIADTLARGLGRPERPLPTPSVGAPGRQPVPGAVVDPDRAWVPMVDPEQAEGEIKLMYEMAKAGPGFVFNVARALTAVPVALRGFFSAFLPNYNTHGPVSAGGLDRVQVELLASSTSAFNDCFY